jgi:predicted DNA-binding transcriptional regulator AlpA
MREPTTSPTISDSRTDARLQPYVNLGVLPLDVARHRILDVKETAVFLSLSVPSVRRLHRAKQIPEAVRLSSRRIGWKLGDLIAWLEARQTRPVAA